jgi:hypothetical protein
MILKLDDYSQALEHKSIILGDTKAFYIHSPSINNKNKLCLVNTSGGISRQKHHSLRYVAQSGDTTQINILFEAVL